MVFLYSFLRRWGNSVSIDYITGQLIRPKTVN
nr:MAG TPA: Phosphotyrosyl phosphate activator (PTPA) protein [Caudoviricetes sp.]